METKGSNYWDVTAVLLRGQALENPAAKPP
jgi:hypothetical protein